MYNSLQLRLHKASGRFGQSEEGQREKRLLVGNKIEVVYIDEVFYGLGIYSMISAPN